MDASTIIGIIGAAVTLVGAGWGFVKWISAQIEGMREGITAEIGKLGEKISVISTEKAAEIADLRARMTIAEKRIDDREHQCDEAIKRLHIRIDSIKPVLAIFILPMLLLVGCNRTSEAVVALNADQALEFVEQSGELSSDATRAATASARADVQTLAKIADPEAQPSATAEKWEDPQAAIAGTDEARKAAVDDAEASSWISGLFGSALTWGVGLLGLGGAAAFALRKYQVIKSALHGAVKFGNTVKLALEANDPEAAHAIVAAAKAEHQTSPKAHALINKAKAKADVYQAQWKRGAVGSVSNYLGERIQRDALEPHDISDDETVIINPVNVPRGTKE